MCLLIPLALNGSLPFLHQFQATSDINDPAFEKAFSIGAAFMLLAQPAVCALVTHYLARRVDEALDAAVLPCDHVEIPSLLQLLQIAVSDSSPSANETSVRVLSRDGASYVCFRSLMRGQC